ncbi:hypothetical protein FH972_010357 [Carpinus fangiana]|uniref:Uncharacterized protein n=1 Tax=Carpinus fangiana TaxID=176857 RepID=A0A660KQ26_9ROSI|nr:hypothetical protein FH972_010357 [Carpinus fangiana]
MGIWPGQPGRHRPPSHLGAPPSAWSQQEAALVRHRQPRMSGLRFAMAASTMTCKFLGHDPSFSSRNANASLSAFRPVFTHPPIRTRFPASPAPPSGQDTMDWIGMRSENLTFGTSEDETTFGVSLKTHPCP